MTTISRLNQPLHQLPLLKDGSIIQTEGLHPVAEGAAGVTVQDVCPILFIHRHHLTLHALWAWHCLPITPGLPMGVTVEAEGMRSSLAELSKTLFALNVVSVGRNHQTSRFQLDAVAWTEGESGPFCKEGA